VLQLAVNGDSISSYAEKLVELVARKTSRTAALSTFADSLSQIVNERFAKPIGTVGERWTPSYYTGSNIGNWLCDQLRERYQTNVALVNAGGIRAGFDTGPVTVLDVLEALPFENAITVFNATGYDILKIATEQARAQGEHKHGVLEMSGMDITYRVRGTSAEPTDVKIAGKPICPDSIYRVVTIDYVSVSQPDRYLGFQPRNQENTGEMISDFAIDAIRKSASALKADPEPRLREDISTDEETR
jgi:5'-nucleotidase/UDP-sugar diphosphatase